MRAIQLRVPGGDQPLYLRIADAIREGLKKGLAQPGEKLPSTRELSESLGAHRNTVIAALAELTAEGWVRSELRKAYRVSDVLPGHFFVTNEAGSRTRRPQEQPQRHFRWQLAYESDLERLRPESGMRYAFRWGFPDLSKFPYAEFRSHYIDALRRPKPALFDYGSSRGHPPLLALLEEYLRRLRGIRGREVFVMNGSGEGMFLAAQVLLKPGDSVAMEEPGYPAAFEMFRALRARVVPIRVESDGLDVDALDRAAARRRIKLAFVTPLHQFPTTVTMSAQKRLRLYEIAARRGFALLEDDYDHEFHYRTQPLPPLAAADPEGLVIHAGTFSKVLFPSIRIGFLAVPKPLARPIEQLRRLTVHQNDVISQEALARWTATGGLERHLRRMRRLYHAKRDALLDALAQARSAGAPFEWAAPDGGTAVWVDTGQDSRRFAAHATARSVFVSPEALYRHTEGPANHVRLGFSTPSFDEIREGIAALAR